MSRIQAVFERLAEEKRAGLAAFITACDPDFSTSLDIAKALIEAQCDLIELGMAFSDPMAEGKVIQASSARALSAGATMKKNFELVEHIRLFDSQTPIIFMGYSNPIFHYGFERWAQDAQKAGADGAIIVDLPPEEDGVLRDAAKDCGLAIIRLVAPTSQNRLDMLINHAQGFLYYISVKGITGASAPDFLQVRDNIALIRQKTTLPIALGFGIKSVDDSKQAALLADLVVIGSALIDSFADKEDKAKACFDFVQKHRQAIASIVKSPLQ